MSEKELFPGFYKLNSLFVENILSSTNRMDISGMVPSMVIEESMTNDCIRGSFRVFDYTGFMEKFPLRGEEKLTILLEDALGTIQEYVGFLYKIDNVITTDTNNGVSYFCHFLTLQRFNASSNRIVRSYRDRKVSEIIQELFDEFYVGSEKKLNIVSNTENNINCVIPNMYVHQAIDFLTRRSYNSESASLSFRFYENAKEFVFASDDELLLQNIALDPKQFYSYSNIPLSNSTFNLQMHNFDKLENFKRINTYDDILGGSYKSNAIELNLLDGTANIKNPKKKYDYIQTRRDFLRAFSKNKIFVDNHTTEFINAYFTETNAKTFLVLKDYETSKIETTLDPNEFISEISMYKTSYLKQSNKIIFKTSGPGRFDVTCGDTIRLSVYEAYASGVEPKENERISGVYTIRKIDRIFDNETFTNHYVLAKNDWSKTEELKLRNVQDFLNRGLRNL